MAGQKKQSSNLFILKMAETLNPNSSPSSTPASNRLWRPAAQRNLRNQWSKLASLKQQWLSASNSGRSHATCLINAFLSQKYMPAMELGVLLDMPDIKNKACSKLIKQQELNRSKLLSSYKNMVTVVTNMVTISRSMRCFSKGTNSTSLVQFSSCSEDKDDPGDGGGISVFAFSSIPIFEKFAKELVHMFESELVLKRLLVVQLLSLSCEDPQTNVLSWSAELYPGEFNELSTCDLYSEETNEPIPPRLKDGEFETPVVEFKHPPNREVLQVYLTTWLAEVNIDNLRVDEIFATIGEEMHVILVGMLVN